MDAGDRGGQSFGAYVLGLAFALAGPRALARNWGQSCHLPRPRPSAPGTLLLGIYAAGLGIPFLLAAIFITRAMGVMNQIKRHMKLIERSWGAY